MECLAGQLWNDFYDNHRAKFFKDRHWLGREWPELALAGDGEGTEEPGGGVGGVGVVEVRHFFLGFFFSFQNSRSPSSLFSLLEKKTHREIHHYQKQVGCGVGNAALPLLDVVAPPAPVYACDFSATAVEIFRKTPAALRSGGRLRAFVADAARPGALTSDTDFPIRSHSLAAATLIFALSAMSPAAMVVAVDNVKRVLSETGGRAFVRDYAVGDMASARLAGRSTPRRLHAWLPAGSGRAAAGRESTSKGESNGGDVDTSVARAEAAATLLSGGEFFARGDGTRAFYFSEAGLRRLFESAGFETESIGTG